MNLKKPEQFLFFKGGGRIGEKLNRYSQTCLIMIHNNCVHNLLPAVDLYVIFTSISFIAKPIDNLSLYPHQMQF